MYYYYKLIFFAISLANIECGHYLVRKESEKASNNQMNKTEGNINETRSLGFRKNIIYDVTDKSNITIGRKDNDYIDDYSSEHSTACDPKIFNCEPEPKPTATRTTRTDP